MKKMMMKLWKDEEGATAIEYGVMIALISAALVAIVGTISGQLQAAFQTVSAALTGAAAP